MNRYEFLKEVKNELSNYLDGSEQTFTFINGWNHFPLRTFKQKLFSTSIPKFWKGEEVPAEAVSVTVNYLKEFLKDPKSFYKPYDRDLLLAQLADLGYQIEFEKDETKMLTGMKAALNKKGVFSFFEPLKEESAIYHNLKWKISLFESKPKAQIWLPEEGMLQNEVTHMLLGIKPEKVLYFTPERLSRLV